MNTEKWKLKTLESFSSAFVTALLILLAFPTWAICAGAIPLSIPGDCSCETDKTLEESGAFSLKNDIEDQDKRFAGIKNDDQSLEKCLGKITNFKLTSSLGVSDLSGMWKKVQDRAVKYACNTVDKNYDKIMGITDQSVSLPGGLGGAEIGGSDSSELEENAGAEQKEKGVIITPTIKKTESTIVDDILRDVEDRLDEQIDPRVDDVTGGGAGTTVDQFDNNMQEGINEKSKETKTGLWSW